MDPVDRALARLSARFPVAERHAALPPEAVALHRAILRHHAAHGAPPRTSELEALTDDAAGILERLIGDDLVVLADGVVGAYPFSPEPTPHRVTIEGRVSHAMCSLDAVAIAPVFDCETTIDSRCAVTGAPISIRQAGRSVLASVPTDVRLGVRWSDPVDCAARSMCRDMVFVVDAATAETWRGPDPESAGIFDLATGVEFGHRFFGPLLASPAGTAEPAPRA